MMRERNETLQGATEMTDIAFRKLCMAHEIKMKQLDIELRKEEMLHEFKMRKLELEYSRKDLPVSYDDLPEAYDDFTIEDAEAIENDRELEDDEIEIEGAEAVKEVVAQLKPAKSRRKAEEPVLRPAKPKSTLKSAGVAPARSRWGKDRSHLLESKVDKSRLIPREQAQALALHLATAIVGKKKKAQRD